VLDHQIQPGRLGQDRSLDHDASNCQLLDQVERPRAEPFLVDHARTALIPLTALFALDFGATVGGTVILIEPVFGINGIGAYAQQSVAHLDLPPLMALTMYGGFFIVIVNAFGDLVLTRLDPRIVVD
jgi:ABC-type dipeptide/oligopeptide/nickel transport system permease component